MTKLIAVDDLGRQRAALTVKKTWRWNDVIDRRQWGYVIVTQDGCDFGSLRWMRRLPVGQSVGVAIPATWRICE